MKVLMFSTDSSILELDSPAQRRMIEYGSLVEKLFIVVLSKERVNSRVLDISQNVRVYSAYFWSAWRLGQIFKTQGINLVTAQDPFETGLIGYLAARRLKAKLQLQIHTDFLSPYFVDSFKNRIRVLLAKWLLPKAHSIRVVSERIRKSLIDLGLPEMRIIVLPIFVDAKKIKAEPITVDLHKRYPQFDRIFLMTSRFEHEKNIGIALAAMEEVVKINQKIGLVITGDGSLKEKFKKQVSNSKLSDNVIFEGWVEDLSSYYKTADVFLSTSNYEGYGRALVMTGAASTAIISTDVGIVGDIINKENSLIIRVNNKEDLVNDILKLASDSELREKLAKRVYESVSSLGSKEEYLKKYKESWEMAL